MASGSRAKPSFREKEMTSDPAEQDSPAQAWIVTRPPREPTAGGDTAAPQRPRDQAPEFDFPVQPQGSTPHFTVYYNPAMGDAGPTIASGVLDTCDQDYARLSAWFGGDLPQMNVLISPGLSAAGYHYECGGADLSCNAMLNPIDIDCTRFALVGEAAEVFSNKVSAPGTGWICSDSNGEGLSRVLAAELYPAELPRHATAASWLDQGRFDWVDNTGSTDQDAVSTGCATLFLNWLHYELGYSWRQIISAGAGVGTLGATYAKLTSRPNMFFAQVQARFPVGTPCGLTGDNAFPLWSHFAGFTLENQAYLWAYDPPTGLVAILEVNQSGAGFTETYAGLWDTGYTSFTAIELNGQAYVWAYKASDGHVCIHQINPGGTGFTQTAYIPLWDTGYTAFAPIQLAGQAYVWAYRASDGHVCIHQINPGGAGFTQTAYIPLWDTGYTAFAPIQLAGQAYVWAYRASDGHVCIHQINAGGAGFTQVFINTAD